MIVSHGAMGAFFGSVPKTLSLRAGPRGVPVLALNRRDWGPTGGGGAVLFEDATLDVGVGIDLLDAMGFESVYVAGHSQGTQNAGIYPSFTMDPRVAAVGMYGAVDDGRDVARNLLFQTTYDQDVALAQSLVAAGQGDVVIAWPTIFGVDLFRSPNNYLSYWGPDSLSVLEREIANLETPALLMRADGDQFTPDRMSQNVLAAGLAAGIDISYTVLDYPFPPGDNGGNAHGFIAVEREMTAATVDWLTSRVAAASRYTPFIKAPREQPDGNLAPLADAGYRASVSGGEIVLLDGSISVDVDGEIASYYWEQVWGSGAVLDDPASPTPAFVAPNRNQVAVFMLTVTDDDGAVDRDFVRVDVHAHACVWPGPDANWRELLGYWLCRYGIG
jgi:pimeloyl-ACP methyl ester carboxylesterase